MSPLLALLTLDMKTVDDHSADGRTAKSSPARSPSYINNL